MQEGGAGLAQVAQVHLRHRRGGGCSWGNQTALSKTSMFWSPVSPSTRPLMLELDILTAAAQVGCVLGHFPKAQ